MTASSTSSWTSSCPCELPAAVGHREEERGRAQADHDRGEDQRLRQRVAHPRRVVADDRGSAGGATGDEEQHVDAVAEHHQADQHPGEAALERQVDAAADHRRGGQDQGQAGSSRATSAGRRPAWLSAGCAGRSRSRGCAAGRGRRPTTSDVDADVEEHRGDQVDLAQHRECRSTTALCSTAPPNASGASPEPVATNEAGAHQRPGIDGRRLVQARTGRRRGSGPPGRGR